MKQVQKNSVNIIFFLFLFTAINSLKAQTSVFEDAGGESAFKIFENAITVNAKNESISFSSDIFKRANATNTRFRRFGISGSISANEGIANLKDKNGFLIDGQVGIYKGWKTTKPIGPGITGPGWVQEFYISLKGTVDRNKFFNTATPAELISSKGYGGVKFETGFYGYYGDISWGVSANVAKTTNIAKLSPNTVTTIMQVVGASSIEETETAFNTSSFRPSLNAFNFNGDAATLLNPSAAAGGAAALHLAFHFRYKTLQEYKPLFNPALGFYIAQTGAPHNVTAGINIQLNDAFNVNNSTSSACKRLVLNLTAGFRL